MCAMEAGRRGRRVLLLEGNERAGRKILISGGGRCNFTNLRCQPENFLSANPNFARSALARYPPEEFLALVEQHGIPWHEKTLGQLFCDRSAQDIVSLLERECAAAGVRTLLGTRILAVRHTGTEFAVESSRGEHHAPALVVATGGLSIPKIGATGLGFDLARQFGLPVVPPRPALVPLTLTPADLELWSNLAGVSTEVIASRGDETGHWAVKGSPEFREKLLFTHRGLSGPAILQISSYLSGEAARLTIDLAPGRQVFAPGTPARAPRTPQAALAVLRSELPSRLAERWLKQNAPAGWNNGALLALEARLHRWAIAPAGNEGYGKAEVTAGGVDTRALDARSMEARGTPGLFFVGEVVDVTGWLGGYNFQWAWASGAAAGRSL